MICTSTEVKTRRLGSVGGEDRLVIPISWLECSDLRNPLHILEFNRDRHPKKGKTPAQLCAPASFLFARMFLSLEILSFGLCYCQAYLAERNALCVIMGLDSQLRDYHYEDTALAV